jgi:hypothetical protein
MAKHQFAVYGNFEDFNQNVRGMVYHNSVELDFPSGIVRPIAGRSAAAQLRLSQWTQSGGKAVDYSQCSVAGE